MGGPLAVLLAAATIGAPSGRALLERGIQQYEARDYSSALASLTSALDRKNGPRTRARIHVYVGLIQIEYDLLKDARSSFLEALEHDPKVRLPKRAPKKAKRLFAEVRAELGVKRRRRPRRTRPRPEPPAPVVEAPTPPAPAPDPPPVQDIAPPPPVEAPAPPPPAPAPPPPRLTPPEVVATPDPGPNVPGWVLASVGGAALITGAVVTGVSASTEARADDEVVAARAQALYQDAVTQRTAGLVTLGVGAALGGLAIYFFSAD